jgi:hypothetical protein
MRRKPFMNNSRWRIILFALLLPLALPAGARPAVPLAKPSHLQLAARATLSLDEAVRQVKHRTGGRILTAETVVRKGRRVHRIKVLMPNGHVKVKYIDAE